ncbi:hypothetical protein D3C76_1202790 [compost metagenome]
MGDAQGVMARVHMQELDAERRAGAVADAEAEHLLVQPAQLVEMRGDQGDVADAQLAGAEAAQRPTGHEGRLGVGQAPGHLDAHAVRIAEMAHAGDAAQGDFLRRAADGRVAGLLQRPPDFLQFLGRAHLEAHGHGRLAVAGLHQQPLDLAVHAQSRADARLDHLHLQADMLAGHLQPLLHVRRMRHHVAQCIDHCRRPHSADMPPSTERVVPVT